MFTKRFSVLCAVLALILSACGSAPKKGMYTVGIIVELSWLNPIVDGFKETMTELGYVEGENVTYLYNPDAGPDQEAFDKEAVRLMEQNVDIFFTVGTLPTKSAQKAVEGTDVPVVFDPVINPVEEGVVNSIAQPGGNVTGIQVINRGEKGLEWALKIAPDTQYAYIPYNPDDPFTSMIVQSLFESLKQQGVELLPSSAATTAEEMAAAVETMPENTLIFISLLAPNLEAGLPDLTKQAEKYDVPVFATGRGGEAPFAIADYTTTFLGEAQQGARMVDRVLKGADPASTPVETAEYYLFINLNAAEAYNVQVSNDILSQASTVIR